MIFLVFNYNFLYDGGFSQWCPRVLRLTVPTWRFPRSYPAPIPPSRCQAWWTRARRFSGPPTALARRIRPPEAVIPAFRRDWRGSRASRRGCRRPKTITSRTIRKLRWSIKNCGRSFINMELKWSSLKLEGKIFYSLSKLMFLTDGKVGDKIIFFIIWYFISQDYFI